MILFEDQHGLCCRPPELIASITPAFPNRLRIVASDATVGYCYQLEELNQPGLCQISPKNWLNPRHVRRLEVSGERMLITLDNGEKHKVSGKWMPAVRDFLGLNRHVFQPACLTRIFLREYPFEIAWAEARVPPRQLIANVIWQALEFIRLGQDKGYGYTHHGFFYKPLHAVLERA